jgi:hypothetical protein
MYKDKAIKYYTDHPKFHKAYSAATAMDNSLIKEYGKEGSTDCRFMMDNYLKYFDYESLKANKCL